MFAGLPPFDPAAALATLVQPPAQAKAELLVARAVATVPPAAAAAALPPPAPHEGDAPLDSLLERLELLQLSDLLKKNLVTDVATLGMLTVAEMAEIGVPLGARKKIHQALHPPAERNASEGVGLCVVCLEGQRVHGQGVRPQGGVRVGRAVAEQVSHVPARSGVHAHLLRVSSVHSAHNMHVY